MKQAKTLHPEAIAARAGQHAWSTLSEEAWLSLAVDQATRFWSKVRKTPHCWLWTAGVDKDGYGKFQITGRGARFPGDRPVQKHVRAHRLSWELTHGTPAPSGLVTIHRCDVPACVRPNHVRFGTQGDNRADCYAKGRNATGDRSGRRLHPERYPSGSQHPSRLHPERMARGERHGLSKLREADVMDIREQHAAGTSSRMLAARFHCNRSTIIGIVSRRSWAHVK